MPIFDVYCEWGASRWTTGDMTELADKLGRAGVTHAGVASLLAARSNFLEGNYKLNAALQSPPQGPRLFGYLTLNPNYPDQSGQDLKRYMSSRAWIGARLDPDTSGQPLESVATDDLIQSYRRYVKPLVVHVSGESEVQHLGEVARAVPQMKIVVLHAGGDAWVDCLALAKKQLNLILEPCSGGTDRGKIEQAVELIGAHRVVFGSGYPRQAPGAALGAVADARIAEHDRAAVLSGTAMRLFGLTRATAEPDEDEE
jgi:uncharacterized protein